MLRVKLRNQYVGSLVIDRGDPVDINSVIKDVVRSKEHNGVMFEIALDFKFIDEGWTFVKKSFELGGGIDSLTFVDIFKYNFTNYVWESYYSGKINFNRYSRNQRDITVNIEQAGIDRLVLNSMDKEVDMETRRAFDGTALPEQLTQLSPFHSKKILVQLISKVGVEQETFTTSETSSSLRVYYSLPLKPSINDLEANEYPFNFSIFDPTEVQKFDWVTPDDGSYKFDFVNLPIRADTDIAISAVLGFQYILAHGRDGSYTKQILFSADADKDVGFDTVLNTSTTIDLLKGDEVYIYIILFPPVAPLAPATTTIFSSPSGGLISSINVEALTTFAPTDVKNILLHELFDRAIAYATGEVGLFYSDLLGRTDIGYAVDGKYSLISFTNGKWLRGRTLFLEEGQASLDIRVRLTESLRELIRFVNSLTPIGFGFEVIDGKRIFRLESIEHFFNKDLKAASIGKVEVETELVSDMFYNEVIYGYSEEVNIKLVNGIDCFNTLRKASIPISNTKNSLDISTKINADGHIIESQRRLTHTTEDSTYDDKNFAVVMERLTGGGYGTKQLSAAAILNNNVVNVVDPGSGYNYDISPRTNLENWKYVLAASLVKSFNKNVQFTSGTLNYFMGKRSSVFSPYVFENSDLDLTNVEAIWENDKYTIKQVPVTDELIDLIGQNYFGFIEFVDGYGKVGEGFIMPGGGIKHNSNAQQADFILLKVNRA